MECEGRGVGEVMEDREEVKLETEQTRPFLKLKNINTLLEKPENVDVVEIVHDDYEENANYKFQKKMTCLLHKWKSSPKTILQTFKRDFCGLCFIPFPSVDIALIHYKGSIHSLSMEDRMVNGHPDLWKIVLRAVELKEPHGAYKQDIYQMMVEQYEINKFFSTHEIYQKIRELLIDLECKENSLIKDGGRYRLRMKVSWDKEHSRFSGRTMGESEDDDSPRVGSITSIRRRDKGHRNKREDHERRREDESEYRKRRSEQDIDSERRSKRYRPTHPQSSDHHTLPTPPHSAAGSISPQYKRILAFTPTHSFPSPSPSPSPVDQCRSWSRSEYRRSR
jgi:hypothetical protein